MAPVQRMVNHEVLFVQVTEKISALSMYLSLWDDTVQCLERQLNKYSFDLENGNVIIL